MAETAQSILTSSICELIRHKTFYGYLLQQFHRIESTAIPTLSIGHDHHDLVLRFNPEFVQSSNFCVGHLEHEVLHVVFQHLWRHVEDKVRWMVAADLAVNSYIDDLPGLLRASRYGFPDKQSVRWYYDALLGSSKYRKQLHDGAFREFADHPWSDRSMVAEQAANESIRQAIQWCGGQYGDVVPEIIELVKPQTNKPVVQWDRLMARMQARSSGSILDQTCRRASRRYGTFPGTKPHDQLNLAVAVDTSKSMPGGVFGFIFNEIDWIRRAGAAVTIIEADCMVRRKYEFRGLMHDVEVVGRTGTNLEPALLEAESRFDAVMYFTDLVAPEVSRRYNIDIIWAATRKPPERLPCRQGTVVDVSNAFNGEN